MIANSLSVGNVIQHKDKFWFIVKKEHVKPGKGGAIIQVELKDIMTGKKLNDNFRSSEEVNRVILEDKNYQFQYIENDNLVFMNLETYEQENFSKDLLEERIAYLSEGMEVIISFCEDKIIEIKLPETVTIKIEQTEAVVKGQTAAASFKPAILENGIRIMVPQFITSDDNVVVKTQDSSYVERAKK